MLVISLVTLSIVTPNGSLTLDRAKGTATLRRFYIFWIPYVKHIPLDQIAGAGTQEAPFSSRFYVQTKDGSRYYLAFWDAARGQGPGADAVNDFVGGSSQTGADQAGQR